MKDPILLIGGGGHAKSCIDVLEAEDRFRILGIIEAQGSSGTGVLGYPVVGYDADLRTMIAQCPDVLLTIGHIRSCDVRCRLTGAARKAGARFPVIRSPFSRISPHALIGEGTIVLHRVVVNAAASIGSQGILNTGCIVEHDVALGDFNHVSTGAILNGGVRVGDRCFIGSGAVVKEGIVIGDDICIGAGAVVVADCLEPGIYLGSPARKKAS